MQVERALGFLKVSGKRVSNTWVTYRQDRDNLSKGRLIPDSPNITQVVMGKGESRLLNGPRPISLLAG
ncbi:MAG TPA: hypothetical protein ENL33_00710 [Candidatus Parcubacteria bacterium]|nr:hypothetical protein [Candidatus Parcubacteria bacterium]